MVLVSGDHVDSRFADWAVLQEVAIHVDKLNGEEVSDSCDAVDRCSWNRRRADRGFDLTWRYDNSVGRILDVFVEESHMDFVSASDLWVELGSVVALRLPNCEHIELSCCRSIWSNVMQDVLVIVVAHEPGAVSVSALHVNKAQLAGDDASLFVFNRRSKVYARTRPNLHWVHASAQAL